MEGLIQKALSTVLLSDTYIFLLGSQEENRSRWTTLIISRYNAWASPGILLMLHCSWPAVLLLMLRVRSWLLMVEATWPVGFLWLGWAKWWANCRKAIVNKLIWFTNHIPTMHLTLPTTHRPCGNFYQPISDHITFLYTDHMPTIFIPTTYWPHANHILTTYQLPIPTTYWSDQLVHCYPVETHLVCFADLSILEREIILSRVSLHSCRSQQTCWGPSLQNRESKNILQDDL